VHFHCRIFTGYNDVSLNFGPPRVFKNYSHMNPDEGDTEDEEHEGLESSRAAAEI
jgi:hypothetical protein